MGVEIEVKYLVRDESWRDEATAPARFEQGYVASAEDRTVRVRIAGDSAWLTLKFGQGRSRAEFEYPIPADEASELLEHARGRVIRKTRWRVVHDGDAWEVDEFDGDLAGLVTAELELEEEGQQYALPPWLGEDVTGRAEYLNSTLARVGLPR